MKTILFALLLAAVPALAQPAKIKFAVFTPDKEQTFLTVMKPFAEAVNKDAAGVVEIELFPNGALGRSPLQQAQMVLDGVADIAWVIASYTPGRFQENEVFELPGQFRNLEEATMVFTRLVLSGKVKGYDDFYPIGLFGTAPYSLHSKNPLTSIADIKGKKIRSSGAIEGETLKALGAVPIGMPVTEVPEAISRGTVDGTTSHPSPLFDFGIARVTNYHFFTRLGIVPLAILMNRKKFDSLPRAGQDAIRKHSGEWTAVRFNKGIGDYNDSLVKQLQADPKRQVVFPSQAELDSMQPAFKSVIDAWAAKSPRNRELLGLMQAEIANVRAGR
ncbi:MAG TPA: TRAP transporter substrate-binding protein [Burkholderiales bacterium]